MADGLYIYESHLGGLYTSDFPLDDDFLYCDECGDHDWELGFAKNRTEARKLVKGLYFTDAYIRQFLDKEFPKGGKRNG